MNKKGFTLIELLVVIAIIGLLSVVVIVNMQSARDAAKGAKAAHDLEQIYKAMLVMQVDTGMYPNNLDYLCEPLDQISNANEFAISDASAGFTTNGRAWDGWAGPYIGATTTDPWGREYYFDDDYACRPETLGCNGVDDGGILYSSAIVSCGPNGALSSNACAYDDDNIVRILCSRNQ